MTYFIPHPRKIGNPIPEISVVVECLVSQISQFELLPILTHILAILPVPWRFPKVILFDVPKPNSVQDRQGNNHHGFPEGILE